MHVGIANPRRRGKRPRYSRRMRNPQFYVSGKRLISRTLFKCMCCSYATNDNQIILHMLRQLRWTVVTCVNVWHDWMIRNKIRKRILFSRFNYELINFFEMYPIPCEEGPGQYGTILQVNNNQCCQPLVPLAELLFMWSVVIHGKRATNMLIVSEHI